MSELLILYRIAMRASCMVGLVLGIAACAGSTSSTGSTGGVGTSGSSSSGSTSVSSASSTGGTGTSGSLLCCDPLPASSGTTGGVSELTGRGWFNYIPASDFQLQDFTQVACTTSLPDAGCQSLEVTISNHRGYRDGGGFCPSQVNWIKLAGNVSAGIIVGQTLTIDADGGPDTAQVTLYNIAAGASGSSGEPDPRHNGTLTFTLYSPPGATTAARVAGEFVADPDAGETDGVFDSAAPDCSCPACQ
jgi:hypothetical protein